MCIESLHSNCCGAVNSELIIASLPSNDKQTLVLLLLRAFKCFYGCNSYRMGETLHNIKIDLREIGWDGVDWIDMA
jgi:hypothetical protein